MDDNSQLTPAQAADDQAKITSQPVENLADVVADEEETLADYQSAYNAGGMFKERLEAIATHWKKEGGEVKTKSPEITEAVEIHDNPELKEPELVGYIEKIETETKNVVVDPATGQAIMQSTNPQNPVITLPLTDDQIKQGLHHKVFEAIRWLAEWCVRQLKMSSKTGKLRM